MKSKKIKKYSFKIDHESRRETLYKLLRGRGELYQLPAMALFVLANLSSAIQLLFSDCESWT